MTRRVYRRWLPIVLAVTAVANLVLNEFLPDSYNWYRFRDAGTLTELIHNSQPFVDRHYGIYTEMGDAMGPATLVVPPQPGIDTHSARSLGGLTVVEVDYEPVVPEHLIPTGPPIGEIEVGDRLLHYWILPGGDDERWWLGRVPDGFVFVPESVAPAPEGAS